MNDWTLPTDATTGEAISPADLKAQIDALPPLPADYDWDLELDWSAVGDPPTCWCGFDDCEKCFPDEA